MHEPKRELKPCPHCGSTPNPIPQHSSIPTADGRWFTFIWCENCGAKGGEQPTEERAIAAWNRRSPLPPHHRSPACLSSRTNSASARQRV